MDDSIDSILIDAKRKQELMVKVFRMAADEFLSARAIHCLGNEPKPHLGDKRTKWGRTCLAVNQALRRLGYSGFWPTWFNPREHQDDADKFSKEILRTMKLMGVPTGDSHSAFSFIRENVQAVRYSWLHFVADRIEEGEL